MVSVATEEGISDATLYKRLKQCRKQGKPVPVRNKTGDEWSGEAKLAVVIETAPLLVLSKKLEALYGSDQDNEDSQPP